MTVYARHMGPTESCTVLFPEHRRHQATISFRKGELHERNRDETEAVVGARQLVQVAAVVVDGRWVERACRW
jgi:hypothetical protein